MVDYYKSLNLEKLRQSQVKSQKEVKMECEENLSRIKVPKNRGIGRVPGDSSSSELEDQKSSGENSYKHHTQKQQFYNPI